MYHQICLTRFSSCLKEKFIVEWHHPVNIYYFSSWLYFYQLISTFLISILYFAGIGWSIVFSFCESRTFFSGINFVSYLILQAFWDIYLLGQQL